MADAVQLDLFKEVFDYTCSKCGKGTFDIYPGDLCKECYEPDLNNIPNVRIYHWGIKKDVEDYVTKMMNTEDNYDLRDDDLIEPEDVVGHCMECESPITKRQVCRVNAITYTWQHKDGHYFVAYCCLAKHRQEFDKKNRGSMGPGLYYDFHKKHLELCGLTEEEYEERLKENQPTVYAARMAARGVAQNG